MKTLLEKLKKFGPEYFTIRIYNKFFVYIRVPIFWSLSILFLVDFVLNLYGTNIFRIESLTDEVFILIAEKIVYLLVAVGVFMAGFFTIVIEIIKKKEVSNNEVTSVWLNFLKYTSYPFIIAGIIYIIVLLKNIGLIVRMPLKFSFLLLFIYLAINSFYAVIRLAEILINALYKKGDDL